MVEKKTVTIPNYHILLIPVFYSLLFLYFISCHYRLLIILPSQFIINYTTYSTGGLFKINFKPCENCSIDERIYYLEEILALRI